MNYSVLHPLVKIYPVKYIYTYKNTRLKIYIYRTIWSIDKKAKYYQNNVNKQTNGVDNRLDPNNTTSLYTLGFMKFTKDWIIQLKFPELSFYIFHTTAFFLWDNGLYPAGYWYYSEEGLHGRGCTRMLANIRHLPGPTVIVVPQQTNTNRRGKGKLSIFQNCSFLLQCIYSFII